MGPIRRITGVVIGLHVLKGPQTIAIPVRIIVPTITA